MSDTPAVSADFHKRDGRLDKLILAGYLCVAVGFWIYNVKAFVVEDSFFYLVIARNIALFGKQTFSGLFSTNGVHPLWLYLLSGYSYLVSLVDPDLLFDEHYALPLSVALLALGSWNLWKTGEKLGVSPLLFSLVPTAFLTAFGLLYSEAHAHFFVLSILLRVSAGELKDRSWAPPLLGLLAGLLFLGRLDSLFFLSGFYLWYLWIDRGLVRVIISGLVCAAVSGAYVVSNLLFFGGAVPISGWMKSSFPETCFFPGHFGPGIHVCLSGYHVLFGIIPILFSLVVLLLLGRRMPAKGMIVGAFVFGGVLHFIQVAFFARQFTEWMWYYVVPVTGAALSLGLLLSFWEPLARLTGPRAVTALAAGVAAVSILILFHDKSGKNWAGSSMLTVEYVKQHDLDDKTIITSEFPGRVAFKTRANVIAMDMLTANRDFFLEMMNSGNALEYILDYAAKKGKPVAAIIYNGGRWIQFNDDRTTIRYYDPKLAPVEREIGSLEIGPPVYTWEGSPFTVWDLSHTGAR